MSSFRCKSLVIGRRRRRSAPRRILTAASSLSPAPRQLKLIDSAGLVRLRCELKAIFVNIAITADNKALVFTRTWLRYFRVCYHRKSASVVCNVRAPLCATKNGKKMMMMMTENPSYCDIMWLSWEFHQFIILLSTTQNLTRVPPDTQEIHGAAKFASLKRIKIIT